MINPAIVERSEETMVLWDACLSFLFVFCQVVRHRELTVRYQDLEGAWHELEAGVENDLSALLQVKLQYTQTTWLLTDVFRVSHQGKSSEGRIIPIRSSMRRKLAILFATTLVSVSGATACSGVQEDLQKRAQEEVEKGRQQVEKKVQEERKKVEKKVQEKVQEGQQRIEEGVKKGQQQVEEKAQ
jgi:hypothetical protein